MTDRAIASMQHIFAQQGFVVIGQANPKTIGEIVFVDGVPVRIIAESTVEEAAAQLPLGMSWATQPPDWLYYYRAEACD